MSYTDLMNAWHARVGPDHPIWAHNGKLEARAFAAALGVAVPALLDGPAELDDLAPPTGPAVLKPVNGFGGHGVLPLVPIGGGVVYRNLLTGWTGDWAGWRRMAARSLRVDVHPRTPRDRIAGPWIVEELVTGRLPDDFNVWVIGGRPMLVHRRRRSHRGGGTWLHCVWDPNDFDASLGNVWARPRTSIFPLPPPRDPAALLEAAMRLACRVDGPGVRVDLYEEDDGTPVFGELTPYSAAGTSRFVDDWERRLGDAWASAEIARGEREP